MGRGRFAFATTGSWNGGTFALGREKFGVDVGEDTTLGDDDVTEEFVEFLVVPDGELQVSRDDTGLFVVSGGITSQFEDLSSEVLEDGSEVDGCTGTNSLGVISLPEHSVDTADGELEAGLAGP